ncbi:MAG: type II toxin-antitoxin system VapC family toxin [Actinomycetota bacterium]|nr:type II toxin-antitoxin system VapC family toxin [Actinomycetota bacterium]
MLAGASATGIEESFAVSVVTVGELKLGILLAGTPAMRTARLARITAILENTTVLPVDDAVASQYAELRAATGRLPTNDLWIAATAAAHNLILVTGDDRQSKLPGLRTRYIPSSTIY